MLPTFPLLVQACGLSHREAAVFLGVSLRSVQSYSSGRRTTPEGILADLAGLYEKIERTAEEAVDLILTQAGPADDQGEIEIGVPVDDHEAQTLGWPCLGAHGAMTAIVVARAIQAGYRVAIVPRGSTAATAKAADLHRR